MTIVVGAGMAGLLAAAMLRSDCHGVIEAQPETPNNHSAVLRFRSDVVGNVLNIPFKKVQVLRAVVGWRNPVADALAYSHKATGSYTLRSITSTSPAPVDRYIAPPDLISEMLKRVSSSVSFGVSLTNHLLAGDLRGCPIISTIPMAVLMEILGWTKVRNFDFRAGINVRFNVPGLDAYCSLYVPNPAERISRVSVTGDEVVAECYGGEHPKLSDTIITCFTLLGLPGNLLAPAHYSATMREQPYGKILPYDEDDRKKFIMWASEKFGIYSLGRYATWRPGLLLDDVVNDVRVISKMIRSGRYDAVKSVFA